MTLLSIFQKDKNIKGFSLAEMMVVLAIAGILITVAASMFSDYRKNIKIREAATIFMSDIKLFKQRAAAENKPYKCQFDPGDDTVYEIMLYNNTTKTSSSLNKPWKRKLHDISNDISFRRVSSTEADNGIILQPRGTATTGFVVLQNAKKKMRVDISSTGRMTINQNYVE